MPWKLRQAMSMYICQICNVLQDGSIRQQVPESAIAESPSAPSQSPAAAHGDDAGFSPEDEEEQQASDASLDSPHETAGSPTAPSDLAGDRPTAKGDQGVVSRDEPILKMPSGDGDAAEEGWEGLHDQDVPAAEHEDRAAHPEDEVADPERRAAETQVGPSEREAHLEAQVEALRSELASKDTQLASLTQQLGELTKQVIPVA